MIHAVEIDIPVIVIPNGADFVDAPQSQNFSNNGSLEVFCAARLIERKGQHHLIRAVKQLTDRGVDVSVSLAGTGDSLNDFQRLSQELGVQDRVHFLGYIPREELGAYYASADVFVLPSYNEGMSLAALEALAAALPLVLTRTGGTDDLVEEGINGFTYEWGEIDQLAFHLEYLAQNRSLLPQMGAKSRTRAEQYSWTVIAEQYLELFKRH